MSNFCGRCHRTWSQIAIERAARREQRTLSAVPPGQQQVLRRHRSADPLHAPATIRTAALVERLLRRTIPSATPAIPPAAHTKTCPVAKANCVTCHMPATDLPDAHATIYRSPDSRGARQPAVPELTKEPMEKTHLQPTPFSSRRGSRTHAAARRDPDGASDVRRGAARGQRHRVGPRQRGFRRALPAGDHGSRMRIPGLRQRRLDGHLPREQRPLRLLHTRRSRSATRSTRTTATARSPTSPKRPAWRAAPSAWGWRWAITTTTASPTCSSPPTAARFSTATTATAPSPTSARRPGWAPRCSRATGAPAPSGSISITTAGSTCSSAASWITASRATSPAATTRLGRKFYCIPRVFKPTASLLFHNNGDGTFTEVGRGTDIEKSLGKGLGVVASTSTTTAAWTCSWPTTRCRITSM